MPRVATIWRSSSIEPRWATAGAQFAGGGSPTEIQPTKS